MAKKSSKGVTSSSKHLDDEYGLLLEACKVLPAELKPKFLEALAELEDEECYRSRSFPRTRLHKVVGVKEAVYRADVDKITGWRIHLQFIDGMVKLKDLLPPVKHDAVADSIRAKKGRYE